MIVWIAVKIGRVDEAGSRLLDELCARGLIEKDGYIHRRSSPEDASLPRS
jgi:hypothetical protein